MPGQGGVRLGVRMRIPGQSRDDAGPIAYRRDRHHTSERQRNLARNRHRPSARQDVDSVGQTVRGQTVRRLRQDAKQMRIPEAAGRVREDRIDSEELRSRIHRRGRNRLGRGGVRRLEDIAEAEAVRVHVYFEDARVRAAAQQSHAAGPDSVLARSGEGRPGRRTQRV